MQKIETYQTGHNDLIKNLVQNCRLLKRWFSSVIRNGAGTCSVYHYDVGALLDACCRAYLARYLAQLPGVH